MSINRSVIENDVVGIVLRHQVVGRLIEALRIRRRDYVSKPLPLRRVCIDKRSRWQGRCAAIKWPCVVNYQVLHSPRSSLELFDGATKVRFVLADLALLPFKLSADIRELPLSFALVPLGLLNLSLEPRDFVSGGPTLCFEFGFALLRSGLDALHVSDKVLDGRCERGGLGLRVCDQA
jgi:hypothetical protein